MSIHLRDQLVASVAVGVFAITTERLRVPMTPHADYLFVNKRTIGSDVNFASGDVGFAARAHDLLNQNLVSC